ncbi:AGAP009349-PA-like protein [Anopheles sinensis]|uniref:AGAP009349-PA-like protein n=1 Tax=Anopheles sinensis TaxID=74873 RepID=A0A084W6N8_ANOSI|nr:AGAP009349-PA-like protein [Anopheles sinensis]
MLPCKTRARCFHCQKTITCFRHGTSNCKRHLARKHPNFYNGKEYIKFNPHEEETLDDGDDDGGNYEPSINDDTSQNEEEYTITEMQFVDCPDPKKDALEKAGSSKQSNEMTRVVKRGHDQGAKEDHDDSRESKSEQVNESFLRDLMSETDLSLQGTLYATNVAMQLDKLGEYQRIVAEKLISDVIYNAKLESLCEDSMVVVRVGTFEHDAGEMN